MVTKIESEIVDRIFEKKPRVGMTSGFLTIRIQSARFSKIRKFVPLIISYCEPIFHVIRVLNFYVCQKTVPVIFEEKCLSLPLLCLSKLSLKVENGSCCQHRAPPVLRRAGAPGLNCTFQTWRANFYSQERISRKKSRTLWNSKQFITIGSPKSHYGRAKIECEFHLNTLNRSWKILC